MQISGIQKTTLIDYPGKVAATIFTRGCSFRCPFCHNPELVLPDKFIPLLDEKEILKFLEKRVGQLQGVCITGGEPTIQPDINEFIRKVKEMGFLVKLDSNGSRPERLKEAINSGNIDCIAMDIKTTFKKYSSVVNPKSEILNPKQIQNSKFQKECYPEQKSCHPELVSGSNLIIQNIKKSINLIINSGIDYEFRTTVVKPLHKVEDFEEIGKLIKGAKRYYIQNYVKSKQIDENIKFEPFTDEELKETKKIMEKYIKEVEIR